RGGVAHGAEDVEGRSERAAGLRPPPGADRRRDRSGERALRRPGATDPAPPSGGAGASRQDPHGAEREPEGHRGRSGSPILLSAPRWASSGAAGRGGPRLRLSTAKQRSGSSALVRRHGGAGLEGIDRPRGSLDPARRAAPSAGSGRPVAGRSAGAALARSLPGA